MSSKNTLFHINQIFIYIWPYSNADILHLYIASWDRTNLLQRAIDIIILMSWFILSLVFRPSWLERLSSNIADDFGLDFGRMAEWSKAPRSGRGPKGRGFESHFCQHMIFHEAALTFPIVQCVFHNTCIQPLSYIPYLSILPHIRTWPISPTEYSYLWKIYNNRYEVSIWYIIGK